MELLYKEVVHIRVPDAVMRYGGRLQLFAWLPWSIWLSHCMKELLNERNFPWYDPAGFFSCYLLWGPFPLHPQSLGNTAKSTCKKESISVALSLEGKQNMTGEEI